MNKDDRSETEYERIAGEKKWNSLRKRVQAKAHIKDGPLKPSVLKGLIY